MSKDTENDKIDAQDDSEEDPHLDKDEWKGLVQAFEILYPKSEHKATSVLTRKQKLAAYAVSLGWPIATVSKLLGNTHRNTVNNWLKIPEFVSFVNACSYVNPIAKVNDYIKAELIGVTKVILDIAKSNDPSVKKETKLDAAKTLLKQALGDPAQTKTVTIRDLYNKMDQDSVSVIDKVLAEDDDKVH